MPTTQAKTRQDGNKLARSETRALDRESSLGSTKVHRRVVVEESYATVEYAVDADGSSPAAELLERLRAQTWEDPCAEELPDSGQAKLYARLLAEIKCLADGEDPEPHHLNYLGDGIWELKSRTYG